LDGLPEPTQIHAKALYLLATKAIQSFWKMVFNLKARAI
jgi:hypothetical protein